MVLALCGYCRGCGQALDCNGGLEALCPACRRGRAGQALARFPNRAETELLAALDLESVLRLRRLRRRLRARGHGRA
jgi:hypothetical protein